MPILLIVSLTSKKSRELVKRYSKNVSLKKDFDKNISFFSNQFPKNKKLSELRESFKNRIDKKNKELKQKIIKAGIITIGIFLVSLFLLFAFKTVLTEEQYSNQKVEFQVKKIIYNDGLETDMQILTTDFEIDFKFQNYELTKVGATIDEINIKPGNNIFSHKHKNGNFILNFSFEIESFEIMKFQASSIESFMRQNIIKNDGILKMTIKPLDNMTIEEAKDCINSLKKSKDISLVISIEPTK